LLAYSKSKDIFRSPLDAGSPYLAADPGLLAHGIQATTYFEAYGSSYRFDHCMFSTVKDESSQNNSFAIYDPASKQFDTTAIVTDSNVVDPTKTRIIRVEMFPFFSHAADPDCRYGYDCPPTVNFFSQWSATGGSMIFFDTHARKITGQGAFDDARVDPAGHRSDDATTDPNAYTGTWYSLCD
jgi:hypothetical protein